MDALTRASQTIDAVAAPAADGTSSDDTIVTENDSPAGEAVIAASAAVASAAALWPQTSADASENGAQTAPDTETAADVATDANMSEDVAPTQEDTTAVDVSTDRATRPCRWTLKPHSFGHRWQTQAQPPRPR